MKFLGRPQGPGVQGAALLFPNNPTLGRTSFQLNCNNDGALLGSRSGGSSLEPGREISCVGWGDMGHIHCSHPPTHTPSLGRNWLHHLHLFLSRANRKGERVKV